MPIGGKAREFEPFGRIGNAVAVHAAMQQNGGQAIAMGLQNTLDDGLVFHVGGTLVVDDDIEPCGPIGLFVNGIQVLGGRVGVVRNLDVDVRSRRNALGENVFLFLVVVATAA